MLDRRVVSIAPAWTPMWGRAWLRFGEVDVRATVRVCRWTSDAVGVEVDVDGETLRCWVWEGAVERLPPRYPRADHDADSAAALALGGGAPAA